MNQPLASVIIPAYNAESIIAACIESVLNQTYPRQKYEIIVIDNNSRDKTSEVIWRYPVIYLLEERQQSAAAARNCGIRQAKGKIVALIDSDCIADRNWLAQGIESFDDPEVVGVGGRIEAYSSLNAIERFQARHGFADQLGNYSSEKIVSKCAKMITGNVFYRREVFERLGYFDTDLISGEDADFGYKVQNTPNYRVIYNENALVYHRHSSTFHKLWNQYYHYGYYRQLSQAKHYPDHAEKWTANGYLRPIYWHFLRMAKHLGGIIKHGSYYVFTRKEDHKIFMQDRFFTAYQQTAFFYGQFQ